MSDSRVIKASSQMKAPRYLIPALIFILASALQAQSPVHDTSPIANEICCQQSTVGWMLERSSLSVLSLNLGHGRKDAINQLLVRGDQVERNLDDVAEVILRVSPDVVALQEADAASRWSGGFDHVEYLADLTGYSNFIHGLHADTWLYSFGTALLSRHTFGFTDSHSFTPSFPTTTKGLVAATLEWPIGDESRAVTVISVHLDFSRKSVRQAQIDELLALAGSVEPPIIVAGDLNGEWRNGSSAVRILGERFNLQPYQPEAEGLGTYKSEEGKRLDWILVSDDLEFVSYSVLPEVLSDHLAVVAEIKYRGD